MVRATEVEPLRVEAAGQIFHVADGRDISLKGVVSTIRAARSQPERLFPMSPKLLKALLAIIGKQKIADQLLGDLIVDGSLLNSAGRLRRYDPSQGLYAMTTIVKQASD